jgi:hypothetical protein
MAGQQGSELPRIGRAQYGTTLRYPEAGDASWHAAMPNGREPSQPLLQEGIAFQRADQYVIQLLRMLDVSTAQ